MMRRLLVLFTLGAAPLGALPAAAEGAPGAAQADPADVSDQAALSSPDPDAPGAGPTWWDRLGLTSRAPSAMDVRSAGVDLGWAFGSLSLAGAGFTLEQRLTEHVWATGSAALGTQHHVPIGSQVNVEIFPAMLGVSVLVEPGLRYVVNPGDVVELFGSAGFTLGLSSQVTRRNLAFWELLPGGDASTSEASSSMRVGAFTAMGAEVSVLEALRLRFTTDLLTAGGSFSMGGEPSLPNMFFRGAWFGGYASLALAPSIALHLRF